MTFASRSFVISVVSSEKKPLLLPITMVVSQMHMQVASCMEVLAMQVCVTGDSASLGMRRREVSFAEGEEDASCGRNMLL